MSHESFTTLLEKYLQQKGDPPLQYKIWIGLDANAVYHIKVKLQYQKYIIISTGKDEDIGKQNAAQSLLNELTDDSKSKLKSFQLSFCDEIHNQLQNLCAQRNLPHPQFTTLHIKIGIKNSTWIAICTVQDIKQTGMAGTIKEAKNFAAIKVIHLISKRGLLKSTNEEILANSLQNFHISMHDSSTRNSTNPLQNNSNYNPENPSIDTVDTLTNNQIIKQGAKRKRINSVPTSFKSGPSGKNYKKCSKCGLRKKNQYHKH